MSVCLGRWTGPLACPGPGGTSPGPERLTKLEFLHVSTFASPSTRLLPLPSLSPSLPPSFSALRFSLGPSLSISSALVSLLVSRVWHSLWSADSHGRLSFGPCVLDRSGFDASFPPCPHSSPSGCPCNPSPAPPPRLPAAFLVRSAASQPCFISRRIPDLRLLPISFDLLFFLTDRPPLFQLYPPIPGAISSDRQA